MATRQMTSQIKQVLKSLKIFGKLIESLQEEERRLGIEGLNRGFIRGLEQERDSILDLINQLEDPCQRSVILARYLEGLKWDAVAGKLFISRATAFRLHKQAMKELESNAERFSS